MTVTWAWWLNVIGLGMNTIAAALMYFYPPTVTQYTAKGEGAIAWVTAPTEEGKRKGAQQRRRSKAALFLLGGGFLLQFLSAAFST
jgi:hypothetical protein